MRATLLFSAALLLAGPALAAPSFPIVLTGTDCVSGSCYDTSWTLDVNGSFSERAGLDGTWLWAPNVGSQGGVQLSYDPGGPWPYLYRGLRAGTCLSGPALNGAMVDVGTFDACVVPGVDGFDYPVGTPIQLGGDGYVSQPNDGDGYYNAQDFSVNSHCGEDWNGEAGGNSDYGDPVYAVADGVVRYAAHAGPGWGLIAVIVHAVKGAGSPDYVVIESQSAHLADLWVRVGQEVRRGDRIGSIGDADGAYFAHLHFEMRWDEHQPPGGNGYDCPNEGSGMFDPSDFIDAHRTWP